MSLILFIVFLGLIFQFFKRKMQDSKQKEQLQKKRESVVLQKEVNGRRPLSNKENVAQKKKLEVKRLEVKKKEMQTQKEPYQQLASAHKVLEKDHYFPVLKRQNSRGLALINQLKNKQDGIILREILSKPKALEGER